MHLGKKRSTPVSNSRWVNEKKTWNSAFLQKNEAPLLVKHDAMLFLRERRAGVSGGDARPDLYVLCISDLCQRHSSKVNTGISRFLKQKDSKEATVLGPRVEPGQISRVKRDIREQIPESPISQSRPQHWAFNGIVYFRLRSQPKISE